MVATTRLRGSYTPGCGDGNNYEAEVMATTAIPWLWQPQPYHGYGNHSHTMVMATTAIPWLWQPPPYHGYGNHRHTMVMATTAIPWLWQPPPHCEDGSHNQAAWITDTGLWRWHSQLECGDSHLQRIVEKGGKPELHHPVSSVV